MSPIDTYLMKMPAAYQSELNRIRSIVHSVVPAAVEAIRYGMPGFTYRDKYLIGLNGYPHHLAIYPTSEPIEKLANRLLTFKTSKGTVQFTLDHPLSEQLIRDLIAIRLTSINNEYASRG